jgi:hypothetical protein
MFAAKSRTYGSKAEQHFKKANYHLESKTPESTSEAYLERLMLAMGELYFISKIKLLFSNSNTVEFS